MSKSVHEETICDIQFSIMVISYPLWTDVSIAQHNFMMQTFILHLPQVLELVKWNLCNILEKLE